MQSEADFQFLTDVRKYTEEKVGELTFPEDLLRRVMKMNNKDKDDKYVDEHFDASIKELKWHLIKEQLVAATEVKIDENEVKATAKEMARAQFAQYGMNDVPDDYLENYAQDILKNKEHVDGIIDRTIDLKLTQALKSVVKLDVKKVTLEEFRAAGKE